MPNATYEIIDRFQEAGPADRLLYAPLAGNLTCRQTRLYHFGFEGDPDAVETFVRRTLLDGISQELHHGEEPALTGFRFLIDYGMKTQALDLEKETIKACHAGLGDAGFSLTQLTLRTRVYVFGEGAADPAVFVRDICNPAIHSWSVVAA
ncbi:MAG: hypothetical protein WBE58_14310 [Verrucomicrobiales bacterium]|nr:hypothetical protein [Verrucomicrobiales bacterium]